MATTNAAQRPTPTVGDRLEALTRRVEALGRENAALADRVAAVERAARPRDREDQILRAVIANTTAGRSFRVRDLLAHAAEVPRLAEALRAATLDSEDQIGTWLSRHKGTHEGIAIRRLPRRAWQVVHLHT